MIYSPSAVDIFTIKWELKEHKCLHLKLSSVCKYMPHSLPMLHTHHRTSAGILSLGTGYLQSLEEVQIHKFRSIIVTRLITDLQREITLPSLHICQYKNIQGYILLFTLVLGCLNVKNLGYGKPVVKSKNTAF